MTDNVSPIPHSQFRASVHQFRREGVLAGLGVLTARAMQQHQGRIEPGVRPLPWQAALVAREALLAPSNRRSGARPPTAADLYRLCEDSDVIDQPIFHNGDLQTWGLRTAHLQFPYSQSHMAAIARARVMFDRPFAPGRFEVLSATSLTKVLGGPVDVFIDSAPFFSAATISNGGKFDSAWLAGSQFDDIRESIDLEVLQSLFTSSWTATLPALRAEARRSTSENPLDRVFDFNPLQAHPFVPLTAGGHVAPNAWWTLTRVSPTSVYYLGVVIFGEAWARDLGLAQEDYVVEQARQLEPMCRVVREFEYPTREGHKKSVDTFLIYDDLVVLIESKSLRARLDSTTSVEAYRTRLLRDLKRVYDRQVPRSADLVRDQHPALGPVRPDVPIVALVVTPDPLYLANNTIYGEALPPAVVPTAIVSIGVLENLIAGALAQRSSAVFKAAVTVSSNGRVDPTQALRDVFPDRWPDNPIVTEAFAKGRW